LTKNGKYSLAGSLSSLGHFGIKVVITIYIFTFHVCRAYSNFRIFYDVCIVI
jgi:hypothetical protein